MSDSRLSVRTHAVCAALSAVFVAHYLVSAMLWGLFLRILYRESSNLAELHALYSEHQAGFLRFGSLLIGSTMAYMLARRAKRSALVAVAALLLGSATACGYEISNELAQMRNLWLTYAGGQPAGPHFKYATWWSYKWWLYHDWSFNILTEIPYLLALLAGTCLIVAGALFDSGFLYRRDPARHSRRAILFRSKQRLFDPKVFTRDGLRCLRWMCWFLVAACASALILFAWELYVGPTS